MKKEGGRNETKELQKEFREEGGTNNMRLRDQCFEEIVLNLFSILLLEARLWCEYFSLIFNEIKRNFLSGRNPLSSVGIYYPTIPVRVGLPPERLDERPRGERTDCKNCL